MQTCELLEASLPPTLPLFAELAKNFATSFACLIEDLNDRGLSELVEIYKRFGRLSLKLWQRKTTIHVEGLAHSDFGVFRAGQPGVEADSTVRLEAGSTALDGRPIYAMVRPRIISEPVLERGRSGGRVIWSNAVVWVAPEGKK